jgi:hypothetical protein
MPDDLRHGIMSPDQLTVQDRPNELIATLGAPIVVDDRRELGRHAQHDLDMRTVWFRPGHFYHLSRIFLVVTSMIVV